MPEAPHAGTYLIAMRVEPRRRPSEQLGADAIEVAVDPSRDERAFDRVHLPERVDTEALHEVKVQQIALCGGELQDRSGQAVLEELDAAPLESRSLADRSLRSAE